MMQAPIITAERSNAVMALPCPYREAARQGRAFPIPADVDVEAHRRIYLSRLRGTVARLLSK